MPKQFTHKEFDHFTECNWSVTHESEDFIVDEALQHLRNCGGSVNYKEDSKLLRAIIQGVIRDDVKVKIES